MLIGTIESGGASKTLGMAFYFIKVIFLFIIDRIFFLLIMSIHSDTRKNIFLSKEKSLFFKVRVYLFCFRNLNPIDLQVNELPGRWCVLAVHSFSVDAPKPLSHPLPFSDYTLSSLTISYDSYKKLRFQQWKKKKPLQFLLFAHLLQDTFLHYYLGHVSFRASHL